MVAAVCSCAACDSVVGAEAGIRAALTGLSSGFSVNVPGEPSLIVTRIEFREPQVFKEQGRYLLNALVDAEGESGGTHVSYYGVEKILFTRVGSRWRPQPPILPALQAILAVLRARQRAAITRDFAAFRDRLLASGYQEGSIDRAAYLARLAVRFKSPPSWTSPKTWAIRVDRAEAQVFEDATSASLAGTSPPVRSRFRLVQEAGLWRFTSGLD